MGGLANPFTGEVNEMTSRAVNMPSLLRGELTILLEYFTMEIHCRHILRIPHENTIYIKIDLEV